MKSAQDDFDTGSESESDITSNNYNSSSTGLGGANSIYARSSPIKTTYSPITSSSLSSYESAKIDSSGDRYSPPKSDLAYGTGRSTSFNMNSPSRISTYNSPSLASEYAADRLNQIRSRLSLNSSSKFIVLVLSYRCIYWVSQKSPRTVKYLANCSSDRRTKNMHLMFLEKHNGT